MVCLFLIGLSFYYCKSSLYILHVSPLERRFASISSHCLSFDVLAVALGAQQCYILMDHDAAAFVPWCLLLVSCLAACF